MKLSPAQIYFILTLLIFISGIMCLNYFTKKKREGLSPNGYIPVLTSGLNKYETLKKIKTIERKFKKKKKARKNN